jgi:hypothetical protein
MYAKYAYENQQNMHFSLNFIKYAKYAYLIFDF